MAKLLSNLIFQGLSGRFGNFVFKQINGETYVTKKPVFSSKKRSRAQRENNKRFAKASRYARRVMDDPDLKKEFEPIAAETGRSVYHLAVADYYKNHRS